MISRTIVDQARQGDVNLSPIDSIPADAVDITPESGRVVLMHGEVTGHAHAFYGQGTVRLYQAPDKRRYLRVVETDLLRHEEHTQYAPKVRDYALPVQTEWTDANEPLQVAD